MSDTEEEVQEVRRRQNGPPVEQLHLLTVPGDDGPRPGRLDGPGLRHSVYSISGIPDGEDVSLLHTKFEAIPVKDFSAEVRASLDVESYLKDATLMLDLHETGMQEIVNTMLNRVIKNQDNPEFDIAEAKASLYTADSGLLLSKTIQGTVANSEMGGVDFDQSWLCMMCDVTSIAKRKVVIARLHTPANLGANCQEVTFIVLILTPTREKTTKNYLETGRTFATLFMDLEFRHSLLSVTDEDEFIRLLQARTKQLVLEQGHPEHRKSLPNVSVFDVEGESKARCPIGQGLLGDLKRRLPHYWSDYKDGIIGHKTPHKVLATTLFLYFACVLPNIAFGMLNSDNTHGAIGVKKILFSQCFGGVVFAVLGGQPLIVLLTTAPLALYTKIIYSICEDFDLDFHAMFAATGLWNAFFLLLYAFLNTSKMMRWSSRSTEEIFSVFITFAFSADAIKDTIKDFDSNYHAEACKVKPNITNLYNTTNVPTVITTPTTLLTTVSNLTSNISNSNISDVHMKEHACLRENSVLFLLLMLGTVWCGLTLLNFTKTPFLNANRREILADYALPISVLLMTFFGSYVFSEVNLEPFEYNPSEQMFELAHIESLPVGAIFAAAGLGFSLSLLFFMDQNISSALVNTPNNKLKKGAAYHWDLFVVAIINAFLSIFTLPWVHAALPHSPLHVRALADVEERVEQGHIAQTVVHVRETRVTGIVSHIMIGLSVLMLPLPLSYIPRAVLDGLFLFVAISALYGNQFFERIQLLFTEQAAYPPNHYIRRVPQRKIHTFTGIQLIQLLVLCVFGFSPIAYMKMIFPILLMFLMPIRHKLVPHVIESKFLKALDGH
ncbi:solute carrier family 4 member 11-like isoform X1 [Haliotis asinina]|uniref:solute carrier family 4 member 11-like isoform X1 n=1 Tax=Haliotis asinina TaxID=109174 RepID=UPI003531F520